VTSLPNEDRRQQCWHEYCDAAELSLRGDHAATVSLAARYPIIRSELKAFIVAIRDGRLVKTGPYRYEPCRQKF
jgi:hypothetical protein